MIKQEESYTSKASYLDNDHIPVYGENDGDAVFSGKRKPYEYKGFRKKDGFRGLYTSKDGAVINSDLNGSANIGRKVLAELFIGVVDFSSVIVIKHPDYDSRKENQKKQKSNAKLSKSNARRLAAKALKK